MSGAPPALHVRLARPDDAAALDDVCIRTGEAGGDATQVFAQPELICDIWLRPYLLLAPDLAFVLVGDDDVPVGYVIGAADTAAFEAACEERWWPQVRRRHPRDEFAPGTRDAALVALIHEPPRTDDAVVARFPAHLHVDLLPQAQGGGHGRALLEHLFTALRDRGVPGVHLGVDPANTRARGFYAHLGFRPVADDAGQLGLHL
ncbi:MULTISPECIES: N-acetyltransferase [unclassified Actinotalea]|uniref:GNAT family N-acetyltransferase n=1 Tax=unclassified Actinotalea TaxID=2638618 RepID=UPI002102947E|nr:MULTISPECIES: GNAT family N-acetyltransferase [unclassified Actinotalea]